jgi:malonate-semialdehyde dehydrogenase (acetylating)/methylmalonate-semialdehyde dehydrogenase
MAGTEVLTPTRPDGPGGSDGSGGLGGPGGSVPLVGSLVGGRSVADPAAPTTAVFDPATGELVRRVAHASPAVVDDAVRRADAVWRSEWRDLPSKNRFAILMRLRELVVAHREQFVDLIVGENGKSAPDAEGEFARGLDGLDSVFSFPVSLQGSSAEQVATGVDTHSVRHPLGVVTTITPFNFPLMIPLWAAAAALACGNAVLHKPSPTVPSAAVLLAELLHQAGVPVDAYGVLHGGAETVDALLDHRGVAAASFVGSTPVAEHVYTRGTAAGKRVQAMGGAKNHVVVMPDCDLAFTADSLISGAFGSTGQRCMAATLAVAVGPVADALRDEIAARIPAIRVGPGREPGCEMGPVISRESQQRVLRLIGEGERDGVEVVVDGRPLAAELAGFFVGPTLLDRVRPGMSVYDQEVFGPVLGIVRVETLDEAIALIDDNPYGNGASIFTASGAAARHFGRVVQAGMVGVNVPVPVPVNSFTTGGWRASVFGAHGLLGPEAFRFYTHLKTLTTRWPEAGSASMGMAFNPGT